MGDKGFLARMVEGWAQDGYGAWLVKNFDTMAMCLILGFGMSTISSFHKKSDFRSLLYGFLATFLLIGASIWVADDYGIRKVWWPIISLGIGGASLLITGAYLRFATRVEEKLPDVAADAVVDRAKGVINPAKGA